MVEQHEKTLVPQIRFAGFTDPWEQRKLGELASKRIEKNSNGIKETFTNSAEHGVVSQLDYFDHDITNDANIGNYSVVYPDDFVYNPRISTIAPCGPINRNKLGRNGVMSPLYTVFSVDDMISKLYLEHYFKTNRWHQFMFLEGNSGARSDRFSISDSIFFEMPIQCPVLEEQELIASFFDRLDSLITLHQRKYDKLCVLKKSMLDKMFPKGGSLYPEIRFAGFTDPWEQRKLGELASKRIEKNSNGIKETFTNSAEHGVVSQLDYFDHDITNDANIGNYSVVYPDDFVYNPRISTIAPCGPINRNKLGRNGVMSPLYTVFSVDDMISKLYLEHYFKTNRWHQFMFLEGNSGARSDRFSISDSIFFEMPIQCPVLEEQELIASFFDRLDSLITLHQRKLELLRNIKKSMLDKMFV
ncbi:Type I restriction modification DNA specificity d omain protein [Bifidobacterium pseudocatenulatum]|uniref:Type I restriction modification DNA specificity d omain protein n=2 Tax=Bifidobacterium pseudocatenulatum TaxID=28026 RepID=A0ABY6Y9B7_BIFPS|nr:restriction endonuclease subunit S [Bifidobacterium pseudocatenulatum]CAG9064891.1 Type I restriction modification DNA specificity d omain protein [Bifidobacterium pseudocatenulatum]CAG9071761.1 Type I restriction modification DNA specificity d omain protein [Bifidobacterium pseudocatenulatum]VWQ13566.1 Type I restriction modification DNA specificity d omain protein [Bifidobacterium pseudocatenulatum]VWQ13611.1 Type I restriction modification DNA specificity d omain protein [Bifidobacterium 